MNAGQYKPDLARGRLAVINRRYLGAAGCLRAAGAFVQLDEADLLRNSL